MGLFSTRTPHRPNPIGLSVVKIDRVGKLNLVTDYIHAVHSKVDAAARTVYISGHDLVSGTPVLDIKPYIQEYDSLPSAISPAWISV